LFSAHRRLHSPKGSSSGSTAAPSAIRSGSAASGVTKSEPTETDISKLLVSITDDLDGLATAYRQSAPGASGTSDRPAFGPESTGNRTKIFQITEYARSLLLATVPQAMGQEASLPHVVVFGGTQVGKSTAINVLAGSESARVHHTAGFTRHAQAFIPPGADPEDLFGANPYPFARFHRTSIDNLTPARLAEYCVESLRHKPAAGQLVLWDAPDCDAVGSQSYLPGMIEALALADVVVYVTSGQKYAIRHVLEWVAELRESGKPVVALLNMTPRAHQTDLLQSMQTAIHTVATEVAGDFKAPAPRTDTPLPAVAFEFVPDGDSSILTAREYRPGQQLRDLVQECSTASQQLSTRTTRAVHAVDYLVGRLPAVLDPALAESQARDEFRTLTETALEAFVQDYRNNYLENPSSYDAFSYVGLEILKLLDPPIPGARQAITAMRTVVGIPARLLVMGAKSLYRSVNTKAAEDHKNSQPDQPRDMAAVRSAHQALLHTISREVSRRASEAGTSVGYWKALDWSWEKAVMDMEAEFRVQARRLEERHTESIRETAAKIYSEIARDPVKLNLLRSGRLSADAAAIVLSIKTGGHGGELIHSMVFAPILLSITEAASQMIADNHVAGLRDQLKNSLLEETRSLGKRVYAPRLDAVAAEAASLAGISQINSASLRSLPDRLFTLKQQLIAQHGDKP
jgi:hypothetical protein